MGYEKQDQNWCSKRGSQRRVATAPPPPPQAQSQGSATEAPSWFIPFYKEFTSFSRDMRDGLKSLQDKYSSLDQRLMRIEQIQGSSSHGDPMDTSSIPRSDDSSAKTSKEEKEGDEEEEANAGNEETEGDGDDENEDEEEEGEDDDASDGAEGHDD
ncbi:uncharacterized protein LOC131151186 [Malania oleifera]|uniref:uncharacterized protein LOC131151186 n=1 Tax=Malania oleifera TaxID=397392 RepID=UPI0025AE5A54|nr:uncharacterized protein LOC131151186 [Malania oleifera]